MRLLLLGLLSSSLAGPLRAQEPALPGIPPREALAPVAPGRHMFSVGGGLARPISRVGFATGQATNGDAGLRFGARWTYSMTRALAAGLEADYMDRTGTLSPRLHPASISSVRGDTWLVLGVLKGSLPPVGRVRPFALVGAGGARNTLSIDTRASNWADTNTQETRRLVDDEAWTPAASARIGVDVESGVRSGVFTVEAGWTGLAGARYRATPQGEALGIRDVTAPLGVLGLSARYGWRF